MPSTTNPQALEQHTVRAVEITIARKRLLEWLVEVVIHGIHDVLKLHPVESAPESCAVMWEKQEQTQIWADRETERQREAWGDIYKYF